MAGYPDSASIIPSSGLPQKRFDLFLGSGGFSVAHTLGGLRMAAELGHMDRIRTIKASSAGGAAAVAALTGRFDDGLDILLALADGRRRAYEAAEKEGASRDPLKDVSCIAEVFTRFVGDKDLEKIRSPQAPPLLARVYDLDARAAKYLSVQEYGRDALIATSAFCGVHTIDGVRYTDTALRVPMDVKSDHPRVIFHLRSHKSIRNKLESAKFLIEKFGVRGFVGYVQKDFRDGMLLDRLTQSSELAQAGGLWTPTIVFGPHMDVAFTTMDKDVLRRAHDQGYEDAKKLSWFIEALDEHAYGARAKHSKVYASGLKVKIA